MSQIAKNNGHGHSGRQLQTLVEPARSKAAGNPSGVKESFVTFHTADGLELRGALARLTRHAVFFELYNPDMLPRFSEALDEFKIVVQNRTIYLGRAIVRNVLNDGLKILCEATLDEVHWRDLDFASVTQRNGQLADEFKTFIMEWQRQYKVLPEFKVVIADMQTFLADLRIWLEQVEIGIRSLPASDRVEMERYVAQQLGPSIVTAFDALHERLEALSEEIDEDSRVIHRSFSKRQLHPWVLCSPFAYRTYHKPLGYAGDYEMVNMITRNPYEGGSLFAKIVNSWFLNQWPAKAHRNRLTYLTKQIETEALRVSRLGNKARIFNFACGPAVEVQHFLNSSPLSEKVELTLADFNGETLDHTGKAINAIKEQWGWQTPVQFQKKTVYQLIKEGQKPRVTGDQSKHQYDFVYCAGLFDYLPDSTCKQLMDIFYDMLAPEGILVITNVDNYKPFRHMLEFVLDWHLIYRDAKKCAALIPEYIPAGARRVTKDSTGVNVLVEVRKPCDV